MGLDGHSGASTYCQLTNSSRDILSCVLSSLEPISLRKCILTVNFLFLIGSVAEFVALRKN